MRISALILVFCLFFTVVECQDDKDELKVSKDSKKLKKKSKDWSKVDMKSLEKSWEGGDDEEELELEYERNRKIASKRKTSPGQEFDPNNPESVKKYLKNNKAGFSSGDGGPTMIFVELVDKQPETGEDWTKEKRSYISGKWSTLLKSGSLDAEIFDIGDTSLLLNIKKGWMALDAVKFVLKQPETLKVTKDSRDYFLKDLVDDEEEL